MKATLVSITETAAAKKANRPFLTPELLAACAARYSRNNEGLKTILSKVDPEDPDRSVNAIFRFLDFGHASIGDMIPVAIFIDEISLWLAYYLWSLAPTRIDIPILDGYSLEDELLGGQESSTRYIRLSSDGLISPEDAGIEPKEREKWGRSMSQAFESYQKALDYWTKLSETDPSLMRIPKQLLEDPSEKSKKAVERMRRNYAFDRSRYFLPVAAKTNMMMVMPARTWAKLCQYLLSSYPMLTEHYHLGILIQQELKLASPNLDRHAVPKPYLQDFLQHEFDQLVQKSQNQDTSYSGFYSFHDIPSLPSYRISFPDDCGKEPRKAFAEDLKFHENRYAPFGQTICDTDIRFGWSAMALAEIRDLNRHRTGSKNCPPIPKGFYCAHEQIPVQWSQSDMQELSQSGWEMCLKGLEQLNQGHPSFLYWLPLGVQFAFSHRTTLDKFIYEAELRTGTGAHFRYAQHFHDLLELWYQAYPETKGLILEGSAEPE